MVLADARRRIDWTEHTDAYPELTYSPSCGVPVGGADGCEQCDCDLCLPQWAVKDQVCVCCPIEEADADESVTYIRMETGERVCANCLADLRTFKYEVEFQAFIAEWVTDEHRAAIRQALFQVSQQFEQEYSFTANGNAEYGRMNGSRINH